MQRYWQDSKAGMITYAKAARDPISEVASRLQGKLKSAFLNAVKTLRESIGDDELVEALKSGDVNQVMALLGLDTRFVAVLNGKGILNGVDSFKSVLQDAFSAGATEASIQLPSAISTSLSFDLFNPETVKFLQDYSFPLIQQISHNTADSIRDVVVDAFTNGGHPYEQARKIKQFIGLTRTQSKAVLNYRKALSNTSSMKSALQRALRDGRFDSTVQRAIRNNSSLSQDQINSMVERYQTRYLQYRAQTIARTETQRASMKGQRVLWNTALDQGLLNKKQKRIWIRGGNSPCDICMPLDGITTGLNEEFAPGIMDPGDSHPDCLCSQGLVFS